MGERLHGETTVAGATFKLTIFDPAGIVAETFINLSMSAADPRFAPAVVNGNSALVSLSTVAPGTGSASAAAQPLIGGEDGQVFDPTNDTLAVFQTQIDDLFKLGGIADRIDLFNIVCVPGLKHAATVEKLQGHARTNRAFVIVDGAEADTVAAAGIPAADRERNHSAYYFPWLLAPDPLQSNAVRAFPPAGSWRDLCQDGQRTRRWKAPAGTEASISGVLGPKINMSDAENGQLNPLGIIACAPSRLVYGNVVWGARTLHGENDRGSEWKYIPVRRMALFLEESLYRGTSGWCSSRTTSLVGADPAQYRRVPAGAVPSGRLPGKKPERGLFVKCDKDTTTQADINLGIVNILVGFAPLKPAEFVVLKIQQIAGDIPT